MILSKQEIARRIIEENLVSDFIDLKTQLQPASVDLTLAKVFALKQGALDFDNSERVLSEGVEVQPDENGWLELKKGAYRVQFNETIALAPDLAALSMSRSSLPRCGCVVSTGWWDPA
ncbi:MAG: deoxyuridine 5'-triphosphate nucleotidohydrolase, partial [Candidatus Micrarchaeota archaeon]